MSLPYGSRARKIALGFVGTVVSSTIAPSRLLTTQIAVAQIVRSGWFKPMHAKSDASKSDEATSGPPPHAEAQTDGHRK
jgi:hypothetical protein